MKNTFQNLKYGVVVVTYNRIKLLKECMECVINQTRKFDSILVIDNCSTDGTGDYLDNFKKNYNDIKVIHMTENLGGAGGFKKGIATLYPDVDYVLIIDDDAMLDHNFLEIVIHNMRDDCKAYSGSIITNGKYDLTHRRVITNKVLMTKKDVPLSCYNKCFKYDLATFCGLMISSELISQIGLPKSEYFIWYDDTEYSLRIRKHTDLINVSKAFVNHKAISSITDKLSWKSYYGYRNQFDVGRQYSTIPIIYIMYRIAFHLERILKYSIKSIVSSDDKKYYRNSAKLNFDSLKDALNHKLGKSTVYIPGWDIEK